VKFGTGLLSHVKVRADRHRSPILQTFVTVVAFRRIFASHPTLFSFSLFPSLLLSFPFVFPFSSHAFYRANSCCVSTLYNASVRLSVTSRYLYSYCIKIAECMITHKRRRSRDSSFLSPRNFLKFASVTYPTPTGSHMQVE